MTIYGTDAKIDICICELCLPMPEGDEQHRCDECPGCSVCCECPTCVARGRSTSELPAIA